MAIPVRSPRYATRALALLQLAALAAAPSGLAGCRDAAPLPPEASSEADAPKGGSGERAAKAKPEEGELAAAPNAAAPRSLAPPGQATRGQGVGARAMPKRLVDGAHAADAPLDRADALAMGIDPNGRFATTYRPGGGHLAAFESAVARGIVPEKERELVADVGARYVPEFPVPEGRGLGVRLDLERGKLPPEGGPVHLRLTLRSASGIPSARPHLSVHLVLDTSGSMRGEPIARAREAASALVERLAPTDEFSLVAFSDDAKLLVPSGAVGPRRAQIKKTIEGIKEDGGTNIGAGLELAYREAKKPSRGADPVRVVMLLSDGRATAGETSQARLAGSSLAAFQDGIQTSALGLGTDYDGPLMSAIASNGAGGYYYLRDGEQIEPALKSELERRLDPAALAVEVRVRLKPDVKLLHAFGSRKLSEAESARVRAQEQGADAHAKKLYKIEEDRKNDREGGMRFFMPIFAKNDSHAILLKLSPPAGAGAQRIASVEIKYKDRVRGRNVTEELAVSATYANSVAESAASLDPSVARTVQGFEAGEALTAASAKLALGDREGAAALLAEREGILRQAAETLDEPLFERDADRLARLRAHAGTTSGLGDPLVLAMLLETAGRSHLR